jgi:hypothetical protein
LGHNGRELGLMLKGTKPLAYFLNFVPREFDVNVGTSRHFAVMQNMVATGGIADIDQAAPIKLD